jgi:hypothetical protein
MASVLRQGYLTAEQIDELALTRVSEAQKLPAGAVKQAMLKEAIQLRAYAEMKRLLVPREAKLKQGTG